MMFNTDLYKKAVRERHKDVQREMEHLRLLARLRLPQHGLRRAIAERVGIFLIALGI